MKFEQFDYRIGAHFLSALINGDVTGLDDGEEAELAAFEQEARENAGGNGHWAITSEDDDTDFATCDVSGMGSDTRRVAYMVPVPGTRENPIKSSGIVYRQSARKHRRQGHAVRFYARDLHGHTLFRWEA